MLRIPGTVEFAYTLGLWHSFRLPELVMFGLDGGHMQDLLNTGVAHLREHGRPEPETPFAGVLDGFETQLRPVDESWRDALFGTAHQFYRGWPVPVWQLVWPDAHGLWPWHDGATVSSRTRQAFAWLPVADHPVGGWQLVGHFADGFPLPAEPDSWALTTRSVLDGTREATTVLFDEGAFDVLDDRGHDADDLCLTYLGLLVQRLPTLPRLADLAGNTVSVQQREASAAAWKRADRYP
ncbi:hypothetical protein Aco03nite_032550 [Actinoplanes couchii]|uniref:DUF4262 domain-containing protein n=1 Tax=Actinoplanes couchii TaxID=403638 RepID=A0ABQ3X8L9_9ACTN|nr:hypothetical protein Aco03nite_032550 [Actinoplanes couchii]